MREELLADDLIAGQPSFSAEYMKKVRAHMPHPSYSAQVTKVQRTWGSSAI